MWSEPVTEEFDHLKHVSFYPDGALIFLEGQDARGVYLLCQGRAKLTTTNADGKAIILKVAEPSTLLGLHTGISGKAYDSTLETLQPSQLAFVSRSDFLSFLSRHPDASLQATQHLASDCEAAYQSIRSIGLSRLATARLARLLLQWSTDAVVMNEKIRLKLPWSHQELAQLIGTSRETVSRTLSAFKKKGIVRVSGSTIFVVNKAALQELATA